MKAEKKVVKSPFTGPLGAAGTQVTLRFEVINKSSMLMLEYFCYGNLGGFFTPSFR